MPAIVGSDLQHGVRGEHRVHACRACGLGVTLPLAAEHELGAFYPSAYVPHERVASKLTSVLMTPFMWWRHRARPFNALRTAAPGRMLDVGCGRGDLGEHFAKQGWSVDGLDLSEAACASARARGIDASVGTLSSVPLEPGSYDAVVFRHVLEHVVDPVEDLRRVAVALKPGGLVLVTLPNFGSWQRRRFGRYWFCLELPRHRHHFTKRSLRAAFEAAGLDVRSMPTTTSALGFPASVQYRIFGRCVCASGLRLLFGYTVAVTTYPLSWLVDLVGGERDFLHAVAHKPDDACGRVQ